LIDRYTSDLTSKRATLKKEIRNADKRLAAA